jgi:nucleoside-triphosphatase
MVMPNETTRRWIVTGERGAGKTTFCRRLAESARAAGWDTAGIISLPRFEDGEKTGIQILELRTGTVHLLASRRDEELAGFRFCGWKFSEAALAWGNEACRRATPCDLLVIDEVGPLELKAGNGVNESIRALESGAFRMAAAVIRSSYSEHFHRSWPESDVITIQCTDQALQLADTLFEKSRHLIQNDKGPQDRQGNRR